MVMSFRMTQAGKTLSFNCKADACVVFLKTELCGIVQYLESKRPRVPLAVFHFDLQIGHWAFCLTKLIVLRHTDQK